MARLLLTAATLAALAFTSPAHAQEAPTASLLSTAASDGVREGFAGAIDRILRARLDELGAVSVQGSVALDIAEVQLALGCVGETAECLSQVAEQVGVQVLILPNLDRAGDELVLSVARFDASSGELRRVVRRAAGEGAETDLLDAVDGLLRELFDLPAAPEEPVDDPVEGPDEGSSPEIVPPSDGPDLLGPAIVLGAGGATLVAAVVAAALFQGEADAYAVPVQTRDDVFEREGHRRSAEDLAIAANVLFVAGGVVATAGVVWLVVELLGVGSGESQNAIVMPLVGPEVAGLSVSGRLPELP